MMTKETILQLIRENFDNVKHPGNDNLLFKSYYEEDEVDFLFEYEGKHWSEIDEEKYPYIDSCEYLPLVSNEAFLYLIPYLLQLVVNNCNRNIDIAAKIGYILDERRKPFCLSSAQAQTIYMALNYTLHQYESKPSFSRFGKTDPDYIEALKFREDLVIRYNLQRVESDNG